MPASTWSCPTRRHNPGSRPLPASLPLPGRHLADGAARHPEPAHPRRGSLEEGRPGRGPKEAAALFEEENDPATVALFEASGLAGAGGQGGVPPGLHGVRGRHAALDRRGASHRGSPRLSLIRGVGAVKLQEYGPAVLAAVREHRRPA